LPARSRRAAAARRQEGARSTWAVATAPPWSRGIRPPAPRGTARAKPRRRRCPCGRRSRSLPPGRLCARRPRAWSCHAAFRPAEPGGWAERVSAPPAGAGHSQGPRLLVEMEWQGRVQRFHLIYFFLISHEVSAGACESQPYLSDFVRRFLYMPQQYSVPSTPQDQ
jgi:hypothetical protein